MTGLRKLTWGMKYALQRQRADYYASTTSQRRFSYLIFFIVAACSTLLYSMLGQIEMAVAIILMCVLTLLILRSPDWIVIPIVVITSTIFGWGSMPSDVVRQVMGGSNVFTTEDVLLVVAVILSFWDYLLLPRSKRPHGSVIGIAMAVFILVVLFGVLRGLLFLGAQWEDIWNDCNGLFYFLLYFPVVYMLHTRGRAHAFMIALLVCVLVSAGYDLYAYLHPGGGYSYILGVDPTESRSVGTGAAVRVPNLLLMIYSTVAMFALYNYMEHAKVRRWLMALLGLSIIAIMVNKGRNAYVGSLAGLLLIWFALPWQLKWRSVLHAFGLAAIIAPALMMIPSLGKSMGTIWEETFSRFNQTFDTEEYERGGIHERLTEIQTAMPHFKENKVLGYGYGLTFGFFVSQSPTGATGIGNYHFTHNSWMWHATKGGLLQVFALLLLLFAWVGHTIYLLAHAESGIERGVCWGTLAFALAIVMGSMVQGNFYLKPYTAVVGLSMAMPTLARRYARQRAEEEAEMQTREREALALTHEPT